jgi:hypothetical protein
LGKESFEKGKFKKLYEEYQDQVVQLQAQLEDGGKEVKKHQPPAAATSNKPKEVPKQS